MTAVQLIRAPNLSDVAEYAYAATAPPGARLIFLAGACPLNEDGSTAAVGDYAGQAARAAPRGGGNRGPPPGRAGGGAARRDQPPRAGRDAPPAGPGHGLGRGAG